MLFAPSLSGLGKNLFPPRRRQEAEKILRHLMKPRARIHGKTAALHTRIFPVGSKRGGEGLFTPPYITHRDSPSRFNFGTTREAERTRERC